MINERTVATKAFQQSSLYALWQNCSASVYWTYSMIQPVISPVSHWSSCQVAWRPCFMLLEVLAQLARWSVSSWSDRVNPFPCHCGLAWASCPLLLLFPALVFISECPGCCPWDGNISWHCIFKRSVKETGYCWSSLIYVLKWELCSVYTCLAHSEMLHWQKKEMHNGGPSSPSWLLQHHC